MKKFYFVLFFSCIFSYLSAQQLTEENSYQHLIMYGQSFSTGTQSYPPISTENEPGNYMIGDQVWIKQGNTNQAEFKPLVSSIAKVSLPSNSSDNTYMSRNAQTMAETPLIGLTNHLQKKLKSEGRNINFLASADGEPGRSIEALSKEMSVTGKTNYYTNYFTASLNAAVSITQKTNSKISSPAIFWMQGEWNYHELFDDTGTSTSDKNGYLKLLLKLKDNMQSDIVSKYGQANKPVFITYQAGSLSTNDRVTIGNALVEASNYYDDIINAGPTYQMSHRGIHLDSNGYRWYGEMLGKVYYRTQVLGQDFKPLQPKRIYRINDYNLGIEFLVPKAPLVFDTQLLLEAPNYGFVVTLNGTEITTTAQISGNSVILTSSTPLDGNIEINYGNYPILSANNNVMYKIGNLRDSDGDTYSSFYTYIDLDEKVDDQYIYPHVNGESLRPLYIPKDKNGEIIQSYPLHNFSVAFEYGLGSSQSETYMPSFLPQNTYQNGILYVKQGSTGDGSSWASPLGELADAIKIASLQNVGDNVIIKQIWTAQGTYVPKYRADNLRGENPKDPLNSFILPRNVEIYGGFTGTETNLSQRNWKDNPTILSGNLNGANAYHVVIASNDIGSTILDGFTITGGIASGPHATTDRINENSIRRSSGSGVVLYYSSPTLKNLIINNNKATSSDDGFGGGIYMFNGGQAKLSDITVSSNQAPNGGGLFIHSSQPTLTNIKVSENSARTLGGGIFDKSSASSYTNLAVIGNSGTYGGGLYIESSTPTITNATVTENSGTTGKGIYNLNSSNYKIYNSVIWGNGSPNISNSNSSSTYFNSLVQGVTTTDDKGNISGDTVPTFKDSANKDYTPMEEGTIVDKGNNAYISGISLDLNENPRISNKTVDIGAYEFQDFCSPLWENVTFPASTTVEYIKGTPQKIEATGFAEGTTVTYEYEGINSTKYPEDGGNKNTPPTGAGEYTVSIKLINGDCKKTYTASLVITKIIFPEDVILEDDTFVYGNPYDTTVTGTVPETDKTTIVYTYEGISPTVYPLSNTLPVNAGEYQVTATLTNPNYDTKTIGPAKLTITKTEFTGITLNDDSFVYGNPKDIKVSGTLPEGTEVVYKYSGAGTTEYPESSTLPVNTGEYTMTATLINPNYETKIIGPANLTIAKAEFVGITLNNDSFVYGNPHDTSVTGTIPNETNIIFKYVGIAPTVYPESSTLPVDAGKYTVTATLTNSNYETKTIGPATLTIEKAKFSGITLNNFTFVYSNPSNISITGTPPEGTDIEYKYDGDEYPESLTLPSDVGEYKITATLTKPNYINLLLNSTLTISQAESVITSDDVQTYTYDGTSKNVIASLNHEEAELTYSPQQTYTNAGTYQITITSPATKNYKGTSKTITLVINKANISGVTFEGKTVTYDGENHSLEISGKPEEASVSYQNNIQVSAGTYTVIATISKPNYNDLVLNAKLIIEEASITGVTFEGNTVDYDETVHGLSVVGLPEGAKVSYLNNNQSETGTYEVTATISKPNYKNLVLKATLVINQGTISGAKLESKTFTYDSSVHSLTVTGAPEGASIIYDNNGKTIAGTYEVTATISKVNYKNLVLKANLIINKAPTLINTENSQVHVYDGSVKNIEATLNHNETTDITFDPQQGYTNVGTYPITISTPETTNYLAASKNVNLIIQTKPITGVVFTDKTVTYNGNPHSIIATGAPEGAEITYQNNGQIYAGEYTITATISVPNYEKLTLSAKLTIDKAPTIISAQEIQTFTYNGAIRNIDFSLNHNETTDISFDPQRGYTEVGTYPIIISTPETTNYLAASKNINLIIEPATISGATLTGKTVTYDGSSHSIYVSGIPNGAEVTYQNNGRTSAGTYEVIATVSLANYKDLILKANLIIEKATISKENINFSGQTLSFDGNVHSIFVTGAPENASISYQNNEQVNAGNYTVIATISIPNYSDLILQANLIIERIPSVITAEETQTYTYDSLVKEVIATLNHKEALLSYSPQKGYTNAGTYQITISVPETTNYLTTSKTINLIINPATISGITFDGGSFTYNGNPQSIFISDTPDDATVTYKNNGQINAGSYEVTATISRPNYKNLDMAAILTIKKASSIITTAETQTFIYDSSLKEAIATLNHKEAELSYSPQKGYTDAGTYQVTISVPETTNYLATSKTISLVVEPATISGVIFTGETIIYDGLSHSLFAHGIPEGANITYQNNGQTNAGTYEVTAIISLPNHKDLVLKANLIIKKATISDVYLNGKTVTYDGSSHSIFVNSIPNGAKVTYQNNGQINAGTYEVTATITLPNYDDLVLKAELIINKAIISGIIFNDKTVSYNGESHSILATGIPENATVKYENNEKVNAGTYNIKVTVSLPNYQDVNRTATLIIEKAPSIITAESSQAFSYDGNEKKVTATLNHNNASLSFSPKQGYTEIGVYSITISVPETTNYLASSQTVDLIIEPATISGVIFTNKTFIYDGNPHSIYVSGNPIGSSVKYQNNGQTVSGTYEVTATVSLPNYKDFVISANLIINKAQAVITADNSQIHVYDGTEKEVLAELDHTEAVLSFAPQKGYTDVGTYPITISAPETDNYLAVSKTVDLIIQTTPISGVTFKSGSFIYDGNPHSIFVTGTPEGASVSYKNNGQINAGTYEVIATITHPNYEDLILKANLIINKATITGISFNDNTVTFDGNPHNISITGTLPEGANVSYQNNAQTNAGKHEVTATVSLPNYTDLELKAYLTIEKALAVITADTPQKYTYDGLVKSVEAYLNHTEAILSYTPQKDFTEAGNYPVTISVQETTNYLSASKEIEFIIETLPITGITFTGETVTYDGNSHSVFVNGVPEEANVTYQNNGQTNAGTYEVTATISMANHKDLVLKANLIIEKATISGITFTDETVTYNGSAHNIFVEGAPAGSDITYENNGQTNTGTYEVAATISNINYINLRITATLVINKAQATINAQTNQTHTYDSTEKEVFAELNHTEAVLSYTPQKGYTNVGTYPITISAPETDNYLAVSKTINLIIQSADISGVTFNDKTVAYDGNIHSIFVEGVPEGASVSYSNNGKTNAGNHTVTATVSAPNYNDFVITAILTINKAQAIIDAEETQVYTYDGSVKYITASLNHPEGTLFYDPKQGYAEIGTYPIIVSAPETTNYLAVSKAINLIIKAKPITGVTFADKTVTYNEESHSIFINNAPADSDVTYQNNGQINAGIYEVIATVSAPNYEDLILKANLIIGKAQAIITADNTQTHIYDGSLKEVVATLNHTDTTLSYSPQKGYTDAGTYLITISAPETDNYFAVSKTIDLIINPTEMSGVILTDKTVTYDGNIHSLVVEGAPNGATVSYLNNNQINTGTYSITATVSVPNYNDYTINALLTINKAQAIINAQETQSHTYDGTIKEVVASLNHSDASLTFAPQKGYTEVGNYTINISAPETTNYLAVSKTVNLIIQDKPVITGVTLSDKTVTYDGNVHSILAEGIPTGAAVSYSNNGKTDAGGYTVTATVTLDGFQNLVISALLTINKAQAIINAQETQSHTYDGTIKEVVASLNHSDASLTFAPQKGYTEVGNYTINISAPETTNYLAVSKTVNLVIEPATIIGTTFTDKTVTYDGNIHSLTVEDIPNGATVSYTNNGKINAGTYEVIATISSPNYKDLVLKANLIIEKATISDVSFIDKTVTYDGNTHSIFVSSIPDGAKVTYQNNGKTNAGNYEVTATISLSNYNDLVLKANLIIEKANLNLSGIIFNNKTITYDGNAHSIFVEGISGETTVSYQNNTQTNVDTYEVIAVLNSPNYNSVEFRANLIITRADFNLNEITFTDKTVTYNKNSHNIYVTGVPAGTTFNYVNNNKTNTGVYTVTATLYNSNYNNVSIQATLTILKAQAEIYTSETQTYSYDGQEKLVTALLNHSEATLSYDPQQGYIESGEYTIIVSAPETNNYLEVSKTVKLVITPPDLGIEEPGDIKVTQLKVAPNPVSTILKVFFSKPAEDKDSIKIYSMVGQLLFEIPVMPGDKIIEIDFRNHYSGTYIFKYKNKVLKIIKD